MVVHRLVRNVRVRLSRYVQPALDALTGGLPVAGVQARIGQYPASGHDTWKGGWGGLETNYGLIRVAFQQESD